MARLYLAGYGNAPPEQFAAFIQGHAVDLALDVRFFPKGWTPEYTGRAFLRLIEEQGGIPRAQHASGLGNLAMRDGGPMRLADDASLDKLVRYLSSGMTILAICGCANGMRCYRSLIASRAKERIPDLEVVELGAPKRTPRPRATSGETGRSKCSSGTSD